MLTISNANKGTYAIPVCKKHFFFAYNPGAGSLLFNFRSDNSPFALLLSLLASYQRADPRGRRTPLLSPIHYVNKPTYFIPLRKIRHPFA